MATAISIRPRILFSNPPWWVSAKPLKLSIREHLFSWLVNPVAGVRAGSRWPFTSRTGSRPDHYVFGNYLPYPFFMGYAATYVARRTGAQVVLRDSIALRESYATYFAYLDRTPFDVIVIETATPSWDHDKLLIEELRRRYPQLVIAVTGPIGTMGQRILAEAPVDAVVKGEYEKACVRIVEGARGVLDFDLLTLEEMNAAPHPYFDEQTAHRYWDGNPVGQRAPHAQVWSSRGCPYKCIFCVWPAAMTGNDPDGSGKRQVRQYSADYVYNFLSDIVARYRFQSIYFDDDTFNLGNKHVAAMCGVMRRIGLPWSAMCRADTIKQDLWREMKDSGCFGVKIGFESGNQYVVDQIVNKHLDLDYARQTVQQLKALGMTVHGTFTYGLPGETREHMLDTKRFITKLGLTTYQESGCAEIEGAPLHTLIARGSLRRYTGAKIGADYDRQVDGNVKFQRIARELRTEVQR
jgi:radical SAM superfamily enzyme YgiQ (UPF0313 family)